MAANTKNEAKISLKVMVHKEQNKVMFAEADNNFVDTFFSIMTLPMGTIVRLLEKRPDEDLKALGSLRNLYRSLVELPATYLSTEESKFMMLNPRTSSYDHCRDLKLNIDDTEPTKYFLCDNWLCGMRPALYFSTCSFARCSKCGNLMNREIKYKDATANIGGDCAVGGVFASNLTTFIVTDDFRVMPSTSDFSIQLLCDIGTTDASQLEEMTFDIGREEILILLQGALISNYSLTYLVFNNLHLVRGWDDPRLRTSIQHLTSNETDTLSKRMTLSVILQNSTSKVLFAEVEEDFVDFVFGFLEIPLGTVIGKLLNGNTSIECLDNLFASISNMSVGGCIKSQDLKDMLIQPQLVCEYASQNQIFPLNVSNGSQIYRFCCRHCRDDNEYMTHTKRHCKHGGKFDPMKKKDPRVKGRFLKAPAKFMLTDDLVLTPLSSISTITMLNKLKVPLHEVEKHVVSIGIEEGLRILKASLTSLSTLTDALFPGYI